MAMMERAWLVVEGTEDELLSYQLYSKVRPEAVRGSLSSWEVKYRVGIYYQPDREKLERWVLERLIKYYRYKTEPGEEMY